MRSSCAAAAFFIMVIGSIRVPNALAGTQPRVEPIGTIVEAKGTLGQTDFESEGATVFAGDSLTTSGDKSLKRVRLRNSEIVVGPNSATDVHGIPDGFAVSLTSGTVRISTVPGQRFQISANGIVIQPTGELPTTIQVTRISATEITLISEKGLLEISVGEETKAVEPGHSYEVNLESHASPEAAGQATKPNATGHNHFTVTLTVLGLVGIGVGAWLALVSPCRP